MKRTEKRESFSNLFHSGHFYVFDELGRRLKNLLSLQTGPLTLEQKCQLHVSAEGKVMDSPNPFQSDLSSEKVFNSGPKSETNTATVRAGWQG